MKRLWTVLPFCLLLLSSFGARAADIGVHVVFSSNEIETIRAYFRDASSEPRGHGGMGRGGRSAGSLPPGVAKNLERGKPLPPGIAKQYLPDGLRDALPPPEDGYERLVMAGRILLVEIATQLIVDVISDVILD